MFKVPINEDTPCAPRHAQLQQLDPVCNRSDDSEATLGGDVFSEKARRSSEERHGDGMSGITDAADGGEGNLDENDIYPEGGLKAWSVVLGSFLLLFSALGTINIIGTLQAYLQENDLKDYSESAVGWIFGTNAFLGLGMGVQVGPIFDKHGPRLLVLVGSIGIVLTCMLLSVCKDYYQYFLTFGVLGGISESLLITPAVASIGHWFLTRRATATGISMTGGSMGGIVFPLVYQALIPKIGFPWACRIIGFIQLVLVVPGNFLIHCRLKPARDSKGSIDLVSLLDPIFGLTTLGVFLTEFGIFVPIGYLTSYVIFAGIDSAFAYQILAIFNAGSVFGRWLPNMLADRVGRFNMIIITMVFCLGTVLGLWLPASREKGMMVALAVFYGFGSGAILGLTPVCVGQICRTEDYGKRYGTCYFIASFASLTGIPIAGAILNAQNGQSYSGLIWFAGAAYIGAIVFFGAARVIGARGGLMTKY